MTPKPAAHTPTHILTATDTEHERLVRLLADDLDKARWSAKSIQNVVRAVNAHEELVDACKAAVNSEWVDVNGMHLPVVMGELRTQIEQAIAKAERKC